MFSYFISFRISSETINGKSYNERRQSLMDAARQADAGFWDATTSFIIAQSPLNTEVFAAALAKGLSAKHDMLVVFDPTDMSMSYFGVVNAPDVLCTFFKHSKKLP